jgi:hypothetical protein
MAKAIKVLSRRRRKLKARSQVAFAVTCSAQGEPELLTVFSGRRALVRQLTPGLVSMLLAALSPESRSL